MNLVFISCGLNDPEAWRLALGVDKLIHVSNTDKLLSLRDAAIALDELIYIDGYPVDFVFYCNNESGITKWTEFQQKINHIDKLSDTIYFTQTKSSGPTHNTSIIDLSGNFYCRPHVFTLMGSVYKVKCEETISTSMSNKVDTMILYALMKGGYGISLL